jgi:hypothetical protein
LKALLPKKTETFSWSKMCTEIQIFYEKKLPECGCDHVAMHLATLIIITQVLLSFASCLVDDPADLAYDKTWSLVAIGYGLFCLGFTMSMLKAGVAEPERAEPDLLLRNKFFIWKLQRNLIFR